MFLSRLFWTKSKQGNLEFVEDDDLEKGKGTVPPSIRTDIEFDDCISETDQAEEKHNMLLQELENTTIHRFTNVFVGATKLEKKYRRMRLRENAPLLRWVSALLLVCFMVDCITLVYRRGAVDTALYIVLCSVLCFQLCLFLFRNRLYSQLLIHYYHYTTTALGANAFAYVVLSDTISGCILFQRNSEVCDPNKGAVAIHAEDTTRVAYGMSLLFAVLPFGFRISFVFIAIMYVISLSAHVLLRTLTFLVFSNSGVAFIILDSLLLDTLYLVTILTIMLYGAYVYERNDRVVFLRMQKTKLQSDQLQTELRLVREELGFAEDEANTNELKLEIERAKSDLDRLYPGAQLELESWVMPFDVLAIDRRLGEGSCGEVYRGRVRCSREHLTIYDTQRSSTLQSFSNLSFRSIPQQQYNTGTGAFHTGLPPTPSPLGSPINFSQKFSDMSMTTPRHAHHRREYSTVPYNSVVAVKRIPKHKVNRKVVLSLLQETLVMSKCRHPNVLRLIGLVYDPFVCVIFEYMALGSLKDLLDDSSPHTRSRRTASRLYESSGKIPSYKNNTKDYNDIFNDNDRHIQRNSVLQSLCDFNFPNECVWTHTKTRMCVNVAAGVSYLHSQNILHRDLKSSNLMVDSTQAVKVADLGTARVILPKEEEHPKSEKSEAYNAQRSNTDGNNRRTVNSQASRSRPRPLSRVGSPLWIAPEVISSEGQYNGQCDVWSFGVILCEVMTHRDPYTDLSGRSHFNLLNVVDGKLSPIDFLKDVEAHTPPAIIKLARDCCHFDPQRRCSMKQALFRLLQIAVEQETSKVEADAIAMAGPYLRYSQPSRRNLFKRHGSSSVELVEESFPSTMASKSDESDKSLLSECQRKKSYCGAEIGKFQEEGEESITIENGNRQFERGMAVAEDESLSDDTDFDDDDDTTGFYSQRTRRGGYCRSASSLEQSRSHMKQKRPLSTSTTSSIATYTTAISSPDTPRTWKAGDSFDEVQSTHGGMAVPLLRRGYSTHTLGETVDAYKAQSLLSSFPSMGSMMNMKKMEDFAKDKSFERILQNRKSVGADALKLQKPRGIQRSAFKCKEANRSVSLLLPTTGESLRVQPSRSASCCESSTSPFPENIKIFDV